MGGLWDSAKKAVNETRAELKTNREARANKEKAQRDLDAKNIKQAEAQAVRDQRKRIKQMKQDTKEMKAQLKLHKTASKLRKVVPPKKEPVKKLSFEERMKRMI